MLHILGAVVAQLLRIWADSRRVLVQLPIGPNLKNGLLAGEVTVHIIPALFAACWSQYSS